MKTKLQKRVLISKVEGIENAYIAVSSYWEKDFKVERNIVKSMSFFYRESEDIIIEWEPKHGPIAVIEKCDEEWKGEYEHQKAKPHWLFDFCKGHGNWAQLAVDELRLKEAFTEGDYEYIFSCLSRYA